MHHLHGIDYGIIVFYLLFTTVFGMFLTRRASSSLEHYYLGGRSMPWWLLGIAGMSNWFDLTGTMMITSFLYMLGPRGLYIEFRGGAALVLAFMLVYTGKWHRRSGCMTGAEWMIYRFGHSRASEAMRFVTSISQLVMTIAFMALFVRGTSLFLGQIIPFSPIVMTVGIVSLTALYTMCAGFYGVVLTDLIQGVIIVISCLVVASMAWHQIPDAAHLAGVAGQVTGNGNWLDSLPAWQTPMPKGYEPYQWLILIAGFYLLRNVLGGMGTGAESRYFGARNDRECGLLSAFQGVMVMFRWPLMIGFAVMGIYLVARLFPDHAVIAQARDAVLQAYPTVEQGAWHNLTAQIASHPGNYAPELIARLQSLLGADWPKKLHLVGYEGTINPEQILPSVLLNSIPAGLAGFIIVAMLAAMKGALAGMVNGTSAYFVRDIYQNLLHPGASNRELIVASWVSTGVMMALGLWIGLFAKSINFLWGWIVMGLTAGTLAPMMLRLYWWRCNAWGMFGGMLLGSVAAVVQFIWFGELIEYRQFILMTTLSFVGTIGGSLLTQPTEMATLRHFYRTTRPFGLWGPVRDALSPEERRATDRENRNDILAVPFVLIWQVTLLLLPMQLVIKSYDALLATLPVFCVGLAGMYWFWWRNLPPAQERPAAEPAPAPRVAAVAAVPEAD